MHFPDSNLLLRSKKLREVERRRFVCMLAADIHSASPAFLILHSLPQEPFQLVAQLRTRDARVATFAGGGSLDWPRLLYSDCSSSFSDSSSAAASAAGGDNAFVVYALDPRSVVLAPPRQDDASKTHKEPPSLHNIRKQSLQVHQGTIRDLSYNPESGMVRNQSPT